MRKARLSVALCTDNRLVSRTTVTDEVCKAVETFKLNPKELKNILTYGFKRSFYPGPYAEKRRYIRSVLDDIENVMAARGLDPRPGQT